MGTPASAIVGKSGRIGLRLAGDHRKHRRAAAFVRHMDDVDAGEELEQFAAEILETADASRSVIEKAGFRFGEIEQLFD